MQLPELDWEISLCGVVSARMFMVFIVSLKNPEKRASFPFVSLRIVSQPCCPLMLCKCTQLLRNNRFPN